MNPVNNPSDELGHLFAGVDEVGRGPLAGDVVAAAVILDERAIPIGIADSKKLTARRREQLAEHIKAGAIAWALGRASVQEIDCLNILQASMLAMKRAVMALPIEPAQVKVDGNRCPDLPMPTEAIVGGDATVPAIAAASIIAKVQRDHELDALDIAYPGYGFAQHKGYPTKAHLEALKRLGVTPVHRTSFGPVKRLLSET